MQFLRFVAGPIAAGILMLVPATMSVFAQAAPAPATAEDQAYQTAYTAALSDVSALLVEKVNMDTRLASVDSNTDFPALVADIGALGGRCQAVTDKLAASFTTALQAPALKARFAEQAIDVSVKDPQAFAAYLREDIARWRKLLQQGQVAMLD